MRFMGLFLLDGGMVDGCPKQQRSQQATVPAWMVGWWVGGLAGEVVAVMAAGSLEQRHTEHDQLDELGGEAE